MRNFFTATEARTLIKSITHPTSPETALPPIESPTIIDDYNRIVFSRTGEAYYDGTSELATTLRRRAFDLLGIFPFEEMLAEGFQVSLSLCPSSLLALALFLFLSSPPPPPPSFFVYILLSATIVWIFFFQIFISLRSLSLSLSVSHNRLSFPSSLSLMDYLTFIFLSAPFLTLISPSHRLFITITHKPMRLIWIGMILHMQR
jgi:hypothetical protein